MQCKPWPQSRAPDCTLNQPAVPGAWLWPRCPGPGLAVPSDATSLLRACGLEDSRVALSPHGAVTSRQPHPLSATTWHPTVTFCHPRRHLLLEIMTLRTGCLPGLEGVRPGSPVHGAPPRDRHGGHGCIREPPFPSWGPRRASYPRAQVSPGEAGPALGGWGTRKASGRRVVTQGVRSSGSLGGPPRGPWLCTLRLFLSVWVSKAGVWYGFLGLFFFFFLRRISFLVVVDGFVSSLMLNVSPS